MLTTLLTATRYTILAHLVALTPENTPAFCVLHFHSCMVCAPACLTAAQSAE